jgi:exonuclease III
MNNNRSWNILNWNVKAINASDKWLAIRQKIEESAAGIVCIQETKREQFDLAYINKFCPQRFNKFEYLPSIGASGGILTAWNGAVFSCEMIFQNKFSISIQCTCNTASHSWILTNIYGPCNP